VKSIQEAKGKGRKKALQDCGGEKNTDKGRKSNIIKWKALEETKASGGNTYLRYFRRVLDREHMQRKVGNQVGGGRREGTPMAITRLGGKKEGANGIEMTKTTGKEKG